MEYDLFISHASEDKQGFVQPLAVKLREHGYNVWYDEFVLLLGDSLTERIDYGLANSTTGLLVLSPSFMRKPWAKHELAGLMTRQINAAARILPIWHGVELEDVIRFSPTLANLKALRSSDGIDAILREISRVVTPSRPSSMDKSIEEAQDLLGQGEYDPALKAAFFAFDKRVIQLIDQLREKGLIPADYRIQRSPVAAWEAVDTLQKLGWFTVPVEADLAHLRAEMDQVIGEWSFAAGVPPEQAEAQAVVEQISAILRANPLLKTGATVPPGNLPAEKEESQRRKGRMPERHVQEGFELHSVYPLRSTAHMGDLSWAPEGSRLAALASSHILVIDPAGEPFGLESRTGEISNLAWSPDGRFLAGGTAGGGVVLWDLQEREEIGRLENKTSWGIHRVSWSPSGNRIVSAQTDEIYVWDLKIDEWGNVVGNRVVCILQAHRDTVVSVAFSPDGRRLASSFYDRTICVWDVDPGEITASLPTDEKWLWGLTWSPDGISLLYRGDSSLGLWERLEKNTMIESGKGQGGKGSFSSDGQLLAYPWGGSVCFKQAPPWNTVSRLEPRATHIEVQQVSFAPQGYRFAVCGPSKKRPHNNEVQVWTLL